MVRTISGEGRQFDASRFAVAAAVFLLVVGLAAADDPRDALSGEASPGASAAVLIPPPGDVGVVAMGENSDASATNSTSSKGNIVTVDRPVSLESIAIYLTGVTPGTTIYWAAYRSDTVDGTFSKIQEVAVSSGGGSGFFESPALAVALQPGIYYWLGAYWDQPVTYYYSNTQPGAPLYFDFDFGTMTYHQRLGAFNTLPGPPSFPGGGATESPYRFTYNLRLVENASLGVGSDGSSTSASSKGNAVTVSTPMTLESIELYLMNVPAGTNLYWAVYQSDSLDGVYQKVWEATRQVTGGSGYFGSPPVMVTLETGLYYWLGGYWDQPATYFYSNTQPGAPQTFDVGFGSLTYEWRDGEPFNTIPGPPTFPGTGSLNAPYQQRYVLRPASVATPGENGDSFATNSDYSKGNVVSVTQPQTLDSIGLYLTGVVDGTTLWWAVYESAAIQGTYTKVWESSRTVSASDGYFYSGPVLIDLEPGRFYWLGGFWNLPVSYYYSNSLPGAPQTFPLADGGLMYHERLGAYTTLPGPANFVSAGGSTNAPYWQRYIVYGHRLSLFIDGFETGNLEVWSRTGP